MERLFINQNFKYIEVIPVDNGITWTVSALCRQIVTFYKARNFGGDVLVWVDREGRVESAADIYAAVRAALVAAGSDPERTHAIVCDRMTENIILSDEAVIAEETADPTYSYTYEGVNGKNLLKGHYRSVGEAYKETDHGVRLLKRIRLRRCEPMSPAVQRFFSTYEQDCWWFSEGL
jgi:hypothetical protein